MRAALESQRSTYLENRHQFLFSQAASVGSKVEVMARQETAMAFPEEAVPEGEGEADQI